MYLTELVSHKPEAIKVHLQCIGRHQARGGGHHQDGEEVGVPDPNTTSSNIDNLKELFNVLGAQVTEARGNLERAMEVADTLICLWGEVMGWLDSTEELLHTL